MPTAYRVLLTAGAEQDQASIYDHIAQFDDPANTDHILDQLIVTTERLEVMPERGNYPRALLDLGIKEYQQVFAKPYQLVYRIVGQDVLLFVTADGRRDMQTLLARRLLCA